MLELNKLFIKHVRNWIFTLMNICCGGYNVNPSRTEIFLKIFKNLLLSTILSALSLFIFKFFHSHLFICSIVYFLHFFLILLFLAFIHFHTIFTIAHWLCNLHRKLSSESWVWRLGVFMQCLILFMNNIRDDWHFFCYKSEPFPC